MNQWLKVLLILFLAKLAVPALADSTGSAWAISMDNDLFAPTRSDRDFTAGLAVTYTGRKGLKYWSGLDNTLDRLDRFTPWAINRFPESSITPSIEWGTYGFTPDEIDRRDVVKGDRPYASLVYLTNSRIYYVNGGTDAWSSSLTLGVLGLTLMEAAQSAVHSATGSEKARGWDHQISDGGEPTFRYQLAYHDDWRANTAKLQFKTTYFGSVGYLTEAGIALSTRNGLISSPSHRFNPELITYGERVNDLISTPGKGRENYFWGGVALKARAYNAFLQGQFRHSDHRLSHDEVNYLLAEAWVGYTLSFAGNFKFSYVLRAQTSEIRSGEGDRAMVWGGLVVSQTR
ncbi:MAG: lipid A deacylase LpxR family protein [Ketobacter sp.]|nr:MAG: lipid A deacylase LpxR family protein [Ketobacter sp.]